MEMKAQMELSTLVKLVIVLVVLVVILLFFTGGFRDIGTTKLAGVANNSTPATDTGIKGAVGGIGDWFNPI